MALSKQCSPEDIITYLNREDEALKRTLGYKPAQNYLLPSDCWTPADLVKFVLKGRRPRYTEHMSARSLKRRLDPTIWTNYFKFCVERNPFDKAISLYYWRTRNKAVKPSLLQFLKSVDERSLSNAHIYASNGQLEIDHVIRYEELDEGLREVGMLIGLDPIELPRAKGGIREGRVHYRHVMKHEERSIVERACSREIELFNYQY